MKKGFFQVLFILGLSALMPVTLTGQNSFIKNFSGSFTDIPFEELLLRVHEKTGADFYYKPEWFSGFIVSLSASDISVESVLDNILSDNTIGYRIIGDKSFVFFPKQAIVEITGKINGSSGNAAASGAYIMIGNPDDAGRYRMVEVTGLITDGKTGEPIIGVTVQIENTLTGAVSNSEGIYRLSLEPGLYTVLISSVGYEIAKRDLRVLSNGNLDIELFDKAIQIEDIVVYGERVDRNVTSQQMSLLELDTRSLRQLPSVSGSRDIIKGLTMMPGVKSVGEFSSGINVRGGGEDQNLYLFNGAPLFNTSHVFGLFTVINPDVVDRLTLYKGHIPAVYGERVSSVIDIRTRETSPEKMSVRGGLGLYDSKLMVQLPMAGDKVFLETGGRSSYSDWMLNRMNDENLRNSSARFYDINGALNINLSRNRLWLSAYNSYDDFTLGKDIRYGYGNLAGSAGWNFIINPVLASYVTFAYSKYSVEKDDISDEIDKNRIESGIDYKGIKYRIKYSGLKKNVIDAGISGTRYDIRHGRQSPLGEYSLVEPNTIENERGVEGALFLNDEITINSYISLNAGFRFSGYAGMGPKNIFSYAEGSTRDSSSITGSRYYGKGEQIVSYFGFEPRLSAKFQFNSSSSVKMSYDRNIQYLSLISNSSVSTPSDIWKLSDPFIRPLIANQFAVGYYRNFLNNSIESSLEVYYKNLANVIEYKNGIELDMISNIESQLVNAEGRNYGFEFLVKKNSGKVEGWISYTFSRSLRKTSGNYPEEIINNGRWFPASYDKPHDFTVVTGYHFNKRLSFTANFSYSTGRPVTLPEYKYYTGKDYVVYFSDKNKYRIPDYSRLDLTLRLDESLRIKKKWKGSWSISIMNVYGRKNAYTVFYTESEPSLENDFNRFSLYKLYLIGRPVPTITYNFIF